MSKYAFYLFLLFSFYSCDNTNSGRTSVINNTDTLTFSKADTVNVAKKAANSLDKVDTLAKSASKAMTVDENNIQKASISKSDSSIWLTANMRLDHRIFGYERPDTTSRKMILFSIFTSDVAGNPFKCPYGSYYQTSDMTDIDIKYVSTEGKFIVVTVFKTNVLQGIVFIDKKWIQFGD